MPGRHSQSPPGTQPGGQSHIPGGKDKGGHTDFFSDSQGSEPIKRYVLLCLFRRHRHRTANGLFALSLARAGDESPTLLLKINLSSGEWLRNDPPGLPPTGTIRSCRRSLSCTLRLRDHDRGAMIRYIRRSGGSQEPGQRRDGRISRGFRELNGNRPVCSRLSPGS